MCIWDDKIVIVNDKKIFIWIMEFIGFLNIWIDLIFLVIFIDGILMVCKVIKNLFNVWVRIFYFNLY